MLYIVLSLALRWLLHFLRIPFANMDVTMKIRHEKSMIKHAFTTERIFFNSVIHPLHSLIGAALNGNFQCEYYGVGVKLDVLFHVLRKAFSVENPYIKMVKVH